jgi:UDP-N-acetylglucosamine--N-acetylmuramyl-(pentapeptide) pyrophosphoryl-undecaprenol N-acetylglucosamine transferase
MKIIVTGGGTGGHVYPALEVAKFGRGRGHAVEYWGSYRGQEGEACRREGVPFTGFHSEPLYRLGSVKGVIAASRMLFASVNAFRAMLKHKPDRVFGTGGYSSAPVMIAARKAGVTHVIHEQNSIPGRTQLIASRTATKVCTVFHASTAKFSKDKVVRTGMPVRQAFRNRFLERYDKVFVTGGSQGSTLLNQVVLEAAETEMSPWDWVYVVGKGKETRPFKCYTSHPFLSGEEMAAEMGSCRVCVCRSGAGTIAELVATRTLSILVPYRFAFGNHQAVNAEELSSLGVATVIREEDLNSSILIDRIMSTQSVSTDQIKAFASWDVPDATERILGVLEGAA